jgi:hypothetical protein
MWFGEKTGSLGPARHVAEQGDEKQDYEKEEKNFSDARGSNGDSCKAEDGRQQSDYEEDQSPAKHVHPPFRLSGTGNARSSDASALKK